MKIVVSLSGGMDSATLVAYLISKGHDVECVSFEYGSKHNQYEHAAAEAFCWHYGLELKMIDITPVMKTFTSALLKTGDDIPEGHYTDKTMEATVVPARNLIFLSILAGHAWSVGADAIAIGIHQGDHAIYADCRKEFYKAMDTAIYLGTDSRIQILAPFVDMDKAGILAEGFKIGVPYEFTRTCYKDQVESCGKCGSCVERLEAFAAHGKIDPVDYEEQK